MKQSEEKAKHFWGLTAEANDLTKAIVGDKMPQVASL